MSRKPHNLGRVKLYFKFAFLNLKLGGKSYYQVVSHLMTALIMKSILNAIPATVIAALLSYACAVFADNTATPETSAEEEDELGINITKSGYDKLKRGFDWKNETHRTDYYFDAFDGKSFLLSQRSTPYKLRLKDKETGLFLQFSHPIQRETVTVKGVPVYMLRTKSDQIKCEQSFGDQLKTIANRFFANLDTGGAKLLAAGEDFNQAWCAKENEISTKVKSVLATASAKIVPTQKNIKERVTLKRELAGVKFKLFLEDKLARDNHGVWVHEYGLEAEPRSSYKRKDLLDAAAALGELGAQNGLGTEDLRSANPDATEFTLKQLTRQKDKH